MFDWEVTFIVHGHYADQVVVVNSRKSQAQGLDGVVGAALRPQLFYYQVVYLFVKLHDVVPMELIVHVAETDLGILWTDFYLDCVFFPQKLEFLQRPFEVLNLAENQCGDVLVVEHPLIWKVMLCFVCLQL